MAYSMKTERAINAYSRKTCIEAYRMHKQDGEGGRTVGFYLGMKTNQADAAINAGREIVEQMALRVRYSTAEDGHANTVVSGFDVIAAFEAEGPQGVYSKSPRTIRSEACFKHLQSVTKHKIQNYAFE